MIRALCHFLRGFSSLLSLEPAEVSLLLPLISMRFFITILITSWRAFLYPENSSYILRWRGHALTRFEIVRGLLDDRSVTERLSAAVKNPNLEEKLSERHDGSTLGESRRRER